MEIKVYALVYPVILVPLPHVDQNVFLILIANTLKLALTPNAQTFVWVHAEEIAFVNQEITEPSVDVNKDLLVIHSRHVKENLHKKIKYPQDQLILVIHPHVASIQFAVMLTPKLSVHAYLICWDLLLIVALSALTIRNVPEIPLVASIRNVKIYVMDLVA